MQEKSENYWINLNNYFSLIQIDGPDATKFLQGQLTTDMNGMDEEHALLSACCDPKGRVQANFWIFKEASSYFLVLPSPMQEKTLTHLKKYAVFSKVRLDALDQAWQIVSLSKPLSADEKQNSDVISRIFAPSSGIKPRQMIIGLSQSIEKFKNHLSPDYLEQTIHDWSNANIYDRIAFIYPNTSGLFIPQMIDLQLLDGVSFTKGCFIGQEIIARTQHLGILKRHLHRGEIETTQTLEPGAEIYNSQKQVVGVIAEIAQSTLNKYNVLAVIEDRALEDNFINLTLAELSG